MTDVAAVVLPPGAGRRITGGSLDATAKITTGHPALAPAFEVVIGPGFDVGAHVHAHGQDLFYIVEANSMSCGLGTTSSRSPHLTSPH
jgi:hypothetical protein